jgi:hypothetical protein
LFGFRSPSFRFAMALQSPTKPSRPSAAQQPSVFRSIVSLLIVIHLCCVFTVLLANFRRSPLQNDLVSLFARYTQFFDFDPDFTPYYLTHAAPETDDDCSIAIDLYPKADEPVSGQEKLTTVVLPDHGTRWLGDRRRYLALAKVLAYFASEDNDALTAEIGRTVARRIMLEQGAERAVVRSYRRSSQPMDLAQLVQGFPADDPTAPQYDFLQYEADVWIDEEGQVQITKRASQREVAPRVTPSPTEAAPQASSSGRGPSSSVPKVRD